jgi:hypothetical protein
MLGYRLDGLVPGRGDFLCCHIHDMALGHKHPSCIRDFLPGVKLECREMYLHRLDDSVPGMVKFLSMLLHTEQL